MSSVLAPGRRSGATQRACSGQAGRYCETVSTTTRTPVPPEQQQGAAPQRPILLRVDELTTGWRLGNLQRAGYPAAAAGLLAEHGEIDLHTACELLANGCAADVAVAILL
jgi:hypothetical protein